MIKTPIDVWNIETFDVTLLVQLHSEAKLVCRYFVTERKNFLEREASDRKQPYPINPDADAFQQFVDSVIMPMMAERHIRAWHYTRLTEVEVERLRLGGIYVSSLDMIKLRLDALNLEGYISNSIANALYACSPFHQQNHIRSNKFWMTSHPLPVDDLGVTLLLKRWGGEGVYFWLKDAELINLVKNIGRSRVLELTVPLDVTEHSYSAAKAVVAAYARTLGCYAEAGAFDLYAKKSLGPEEVLKIHSEGEGEFATIARGYPTKFGKIMD